MKKIVLCALVFSVVATASFAQTKKRVYRKKATTTTTGVDSATIYYNLGWDYYKLDSMGPARYYWEKASWAKGKWESKNAALFRLGVMQQNGEAADTNINMALDYYKKASGNSKRLGDPNAIKTIGGMYENGYGVDQNFYTALVWYQKAKAAGNTEVDEDISRMKQRIAELKQQKH